MAHTPLTFEAGVIFVQDIISVSLVVTVKAMAECEIGPVQ